MTAPITPGAEESRVEETGLKQKAIRGAVWSAVGQWSTQIVMFVFLVVLARFLPAEAIGLVALAGAFIAALQVFVEQGLTEGLVQRKTIEQGHKDTVFWASIAAGIVLSVIGAASAELVAAFFKEPELGPIVRWLSLLPFIGAAGSVHDALLRRQLNFRAMGIRMLIASVIGGTTGIAMVLAGCGVWGLVGQQLAYRLARTLLMWQACDYRPGFTIARRYMKDVLVFGSMVTGTNAANFFNMRSADLIIGYFLGTAALGYYTVAYRAMVFVTALLGGLVRWTSLPVFSQLQGNRAGLRAAYLSATELMALISFPIFFGLFAVAPEFLTVAFGAKWGPSVLPLQILVFMGALQTIGPFNDSVMLACNKPLWRLGVTSMNVVANVTVFLIAVHWGIVAVAAGYAVRGYVLYPVRLWVARKLIGVGFLEYVRCCVWPAVAAAAMGGIVMLVRSVAGDTLGTWGLLALCVVSGVAAYVCIVLTMAPKRCRQIVHTIRTGLTGQSR